MFDFHRLLRFGTPVFTPRKFRKRGITERYPKTTILVVGLGGFLFAFQKLFFDMYTVWTRPETEESRALKAKVLQAELESPVGFLLHPILFFKARDERQPQSDASEK